MTICWTVAGSDSGGGAGIQADLKTFHGLGAHGCSVVTGLTAQNTTGVRKISYASLAMIDAQFSALHEDLPPDAVKTGMLGTQAIIHRISRRLARLSCPVVCDPVMAATSGARLLEPDAETALRSQLLPQAVLVTPNLHEAAILAEMSIGTPGEVIEAAHRILETGPASVLIKGGHATSVVAQDYWTDGHRGFWLTSPRKDTKNTHGTGCTLSAAITACLGLGYSVADALVIGKAFINQGLRQAQSLGQGPGPVAQGQWPNRGGDLPWLSETAEAGLDRPSFPPIEGGSLGFYPIVDRASWLKRLLPLGVATIQLRIKDLQGAALETEIREAVAVAQQYGTRLFINDFWQLALKHGAYGVHLGQEDLASADLAAIARAGLRLGVSTHCYWEVARALACRPSYTAIGPIYPTTAKPMAFGPQGLAALRVWRQLLDGPITAIGGISLERAPAVLATGTESIAVISAITTAADPEAAAKAWLNLFKTA